MKNLFSILMAIVLVCCLQTRSAGQVPPALDAKAGAEAVRLFERDPAMVLPPPRRVNVAGRPCLLYELKDGRRYEVDVQTGQVLRAAYLGTESPAGAKGRITPQKAEEIARKYATERFPTFMRKLTRTSVVDGGDNYRVIFREIVGPTGATLPNNATVVVNVRSGAVFMASVQDEYPTPAAVNQGPAIDEQEAVRRLAHAAGMVTVTSVRVSTLGWIRSKGEDRLVWTLTLVGVFPGEIHGARGGAVDARTGSVISVRRPESADYRIVKGPDGAEVMEIAQGPAVPAEGSLDRGGSSSSWGLPRAAAVALVSAALLTLAAGAIRLRRYRRPRPGQAIRPEAR